jgi:hypothetical protein
MKIKFIHFVSSFMINAAILYFLSNNREPIYGFRETPPVLLTLVRNQYLKPLSVSERLQKSEKPAMAQRISRKQFQTEGYASTLNPLANYSQVEPEPGKARAMPRLSLGCTSLRHDILSRDERQLCSERLGRSVRDPSTPTYSIAIPPDKMKAYTEAYERQQELVGGPMPKVLAPDIGPGSDILF